MACRYRVAAFRRFRAVLVLLTGTSKPIYICVSVILKFDRSFCFFPGQKLLVVLPAFGLVLSIAPSHYIFAIRHSRHPVMSSLEFSPVSTPWWLQCRACFPLCRKNKAIGISVDSHVLEGLRAALGRTEATPPETPTSRMRLIILIYSRTSVAPPFTALVFQ